MENNLTEAEVKIVEMIGEVWNEYLPISEYEPFNEDSINDFRFHIHSLQRMVLSRPGIRQLKSIEDGNK